MAHITSHEIPEQSSWLTNRFTLFLKICLMAIFCSLCFENENRRLFSGAAGRVMFWKFDSKWSPSSTSLPLTSSIYLNMFTDFDDAVCALFCYHFKN